MGLLEILDHRSEVLQRCLLRIFLLAMLFFVSKEGLVSQSCSTAASWTDPDGKASTTQ